MGLSLPSVRNSVAKDKVRDFRTLGQAITQNEPRKVQDHTAWLLGRMKGA